MSEYSTFFFASTTALLSFYVYKYHSRHFAETCLDEYLKLKHNVQDIYHLIRPVKPEPVPAIKITKVHRIQLTEPPRITEFGNSPQLSDLPNTIPENNLLHISYQFQDQDYRLVLNHQHKELLETKKLHSYLSNPDWILNGVEVGIDEIETNQPKSQDQIQNQEDLVKQYAGPLQDFYESININLDPRGLLNQNCHDFLLQEPHPLATTTLTVTTTLGEEYTFSSSPTPQNK